jgi:hypothetical protein
MPAQWPLFINNLSSKLASRSSSSSDDFATFLANEYFNAIKSAQTPSGNFHNSGQKIILEQGFKTSFNDLFKSESPTLIDKLKDPNYQDLLEVLPVPPIYDPIKEIRDCISEKGKDTVFYEFFQYTESINEVLTSANIFGSIAEFDQPIITFTGINGIAPYTFTYSINNDSNFSIVSDDNGIANIYVPPITGTFIYSIDSVVDSSSPEIIHVVNQSVEIVISENQTGIPVIDIKPPSLKKIEITELEEIEVVAKRLLFQNDGTETFKRFVERINDSNIKDNRGTQIKSKVLEWISNGTKFNNNLNKKILQLEHNDDKDILPEWLTSTYICKFIYVKGVDDITKIQHNKSKIEIENNRTLLKVSLYEKERELFNTLKRQCVQDKIDAFKREQKDDSSNSISDPYDRIAQSIILYWISTAIAPFKNTPPVIPCNIPTPGTFIPIYYGSQQRLASDIRRALNTGKSAQLEPLTVPVTKLVATALAVAFAKHMLSLKFIYVGQLSVGVATVPMIGFVPFVF